MAYDVAALVQLLRRGVVVCSGVDKETSFQVGGLNADVEGLACGDGGALLRKGEHCGDHIGGRWDLAHWDAIAGTGSNLCTICDGLSLAEIDEVFGVTDIRVSGCSE
jgi:hypothetical protein